MKILAVLAAICLFGCGEAPSAVEIQNSPLVTLSYYHVPSAWVQQVPIGCAPTACAGSDGAYQAYTVYDLSGTTAVQTTTQVNGISWQARIDSTVSPDIVTNVIGGLFNWSVGYNNTAQQYFPSYWSLPAGRINYGFTGYSGQNVHDATYVWSITNGTVYAYWFNNSGGIGQTGPDSSTSYVVMRVDVPFRQYGITNRYFYYFSR